jgi:uncharacterized protein
MKLNKTRIFCYITGLIILSLGVSISIKADVGIGAWDALNVGLSKIMFTVGTWVILVGIILIVINALLLKARPDLYALITIFIVGIGVDSWLFLFQSIDPDQLAIRYALFFIGLTFLSLGISIYLQAKFAPVPIDNLMLALQKRFGIGQGLAKTIGELIALTFAFIFKGPIGIGTILVTVLIGPLIQFFYPRIESIIGRFS